ncbi:TetR/AcrR family transcriptional regulator [Kocuria sp.]|uniref:TetR/AcrR family transcriptional regulator n=1 Tax=Kocuria sp. TaxID=1871328 RepID=UPI0026E0DFDC|nr:TetR/AcrR family transcriptional regulator [Kocuria sp.]MDO5619185.1 helix-turn-helix domain-containing protein [Kocuria sp.]
MTAQPTAAPGPVSRAEETRQRFVDAAVALFREHGYGATSMSQVAAAAGSSRANLYLYFHSKSEIVLEWMLELRPELDQIYTQLDQLPEHSVATCRAWLNRVVAIWRAHPAELDAMEQAMSEDSDVHRARVEMCRQTAAGFSSLRHTGTSAATPQRSELAQQAHLVALMLGTERCLSSLVLHHAIREEDLFLDSLAHQWSTLLTGN